MAGRLKVNLAGAVALNAGQPVEVGIYVSGTNTLAVVSTAKTAAVARTITSTITLVQNTATILDSGDSFTSADIGAAVVGTGIPAGTYIQSVQSSGSATMSQEASASESDETVTISTGINPLPTDPFGNVIGFVPAGTYDVKTTWGVMDYVETITVAEDPAFTTLVQSLAPAAGALTVDASLGSIIEVAPTGNVTGTTINNLQLGQKVTIQFTSDGTHTYTYPTTCKFAGGAQGSAAGTSGYKDIYEFLWDGTHLNEKSRSLADH